MRNAKKYLTRGAAGMLAAMMTLSLAGGVLTVPENGSRAQAAELTTEKKETGAPAAENKDSGEEEKDEKFVPSDVPGPVFSAEGGFYTEAFSVNLSLPKELAGSNAKIYYTLDGSEPDPETAILRSEIPETEPETTTTQQQPAWGDWGGWGGWGGFGGWNAGPQEKVGANSKIPSGTFLYEKDGEIEAALKGGEYLTGTIVRAVLVNKEGKSSDIVTQSYFTGADATTRYSIPVISLVTDPDSLYDSKTGIFVQYEESGREWERPAVFQFYVDGKEELDMNIGIRVHGGYSRRYDFKSVRLYARDDYDTEKWFNYSFFEDSVIPAKEANSAGDTIEKYKRLILRDGGNEATGGKATTYRDAMIQSFMTDMGLDLQAYQPAVVFLNGDYYGMMNIRERFDKYYFSTHYNISKDKVALYNFWYDDGTGKRHIDVDEGTDEDLKYLEDFYQYIENHDLSQAENYEWVAERLDLENYMNYIAVELFCGNHDWPGNNCRVWRYTGEPMDAYGLDGKIRFCLFDTEYSMNLYGQNETKPTFDAFGAALSSTSTEWPNQKDSTLLLRKLMENDTFRTEFATRYMDLLNTNFAPKNTVSRANEMAALIEKPAAESSRKNGLGSVKDTLKEQVLPFLNTRGNYAFKEIQKHAKVGNQYTVKLNMSAEGLGSYNVNTISGITKESREVMGDYWNGKYVDDIPVTVTAVAAEGYHFSHWKEYPDYKDATYVIDSSRGSSDDVELTPVFAEGPAPEESSEAVESETESATEGEHGALPEPEKEEKNVYRTVMIAVLIIILALSLGAVGIYLVTKKK